MKNKLRVVLGFRSKTPWKMIVACCYYVLCLVILIVGLMTRPPIEANGRDTLVYFVSVLMIFLWMLSPAIFLSNTPLRGKLPLFRKHDALKSLLGMMIVFLLFSYLFAMTESWHSPSYKVAFQAYNEATFNGFVQAGDPS